VNETIEARPETMRNQRKMQATEELQQHDAERYSAFEGAYAMNGALGHFTEGRYP
jgi:hypothetical protein